MSMHYCVTVPEDIFPRCMYDTCVENLISNIGRRRINSRINLTQKDPIYFSSCKNNQTPNTIFDEYAEHVPCIDL